MIYFGKYQILATFNSKTSFFSVNNGYSLKKKKKQQQKIADLGFIEISSLSQHFINILKSK